MGINWCLADPNLVASSSKDQRTIVTNFKTGQTVLEFDTQDCFSAVRWSSKLPGKLAATNEAGDTQILSYTQKSSGAEAQSSTYAPKWLFPKCGARFGFGGKLIQFKGKKLTQLSPVVPPEERQISTLVENFDKEL